MKFSLILAIFTHEGGGEEQERNVQSGANVGGGSADREHVEPDEHVLGALPAEARDERLDNQAERVAKRLSGEKIRQTSTRRNAV